MENDDIIVIAHIEKMCSEINYWDYKKMPQTTKRWFAAFLVPPARIELTTNP